MIRIPFSEISAAFARRSGRLGCSMLLAAGGLLSLFAAPSAQAAPGDVVAWGNFGATNLPASATNVVSMVSLPSHGAALRGDGSVITWATSGGWVQTQPAAVTNVTRFVGGGSYRLALRSDGSVVGWDNGFSGIRTNIPANLVHAIDVAQSGSVSASLDTNDIVRFFGANTFVIGGLTNRPIHASDLVSIAFQPLYSNGGLVGLRRDGVVARWPAGAFPIAAADSGNLTNISALAPGRNAYLVLKDDGRISGWGTDIAILNIPAAATNIVALAAGNYDAIALRNDGRAFVWGSRGGGLTNLPAHASNLVAVAMSDNAAFGVLGNGTPRFLNSIGRRIARRNQTLHLNAFAVGQPPLFYQWRKDGVVLDHATGPVLALPDIAEEDEGEYSVSVANGLGEIQGVVAMVEVQEPSAIQQHPASLSVAAGSVAEFSVGATGDPAPGYQWFFNNQAIVGATNASFARSYALPGLAGNYRVVVSNYTGIVTSEVATLTVTTGDSPYVISSSSRPVVSLGDAFALSVNPGGAAPVAVQWLKNGQPFPGGSGTSISFAKSAMADTAVYRPVLSNSFGVHLGPEIPVTVVPVAVWGLWATNLPASLSNAVSLSVGGKAGFAVKADGSLAAWGTNEMGQLNVPASATNLVAVSTEYGHVLALRADGTVVAWGDNTSGQCIVPPGLDNVVAVSAGSGFSLALKSDGTVVGWGSNSSGQLNIPERATNIVAISAGYSAVIALRADKRVVVWGTPWNGLPPWASTASNIVAVAAGENMIVALTDGMTDIRQPYAWPSSPQPGYGYAPGTPMTTPWSFAYPIYAIDAGGNQAFTIANGGCLQFRWSGGISYPSIDRPPASAAKATQLAAGNYVTGALLDDTIPRQFKLVAKRRGDIGGTAVFSAVGTGEATFAFDTFQWRFNGADIPGATGPYLVLTNLTSAQAGQYQVARRTWRGLVNLSDEATLTVGAPTAPVIAQQPVNVTNRAGADVAFQVGIAVPNSGEVFWLKDGTPLTGAWGATLTLTNIQSGSEGLYAAVATNLSGSVTSSVASLVVTSAPPVIVVQPVGRAIGSGTTAQLSVVARGVDPLEFQWQRNGVDLPTQTNATLSFPSFSATDSGDYRVRVTGNQGAGGEIFSQSAVLVAADFLTAGDFSGKPTPSAASNLVSAALGHGFALGLKPDGTVVAWGDSVCGLPVVPPSATNVVRVAAGYRNALALRADGSLVSWKIGSPALLAVPAEATRIVDIAEGAMSHLALRSDGRVIAWSESFGLTNAPPANLSNVARIAAGAFHGLALKNDRTVVSWGSISFVPPDATNVVQIAAGRGFNAVLRADGSVVAWGGLTESSIRTDLTCSGGSASIGHTTQTNRIALPVEATNLVAIAAGETHLLGLRADGTVVAWGDNSHGQLEIAGATSVAAIVAGGHASVALTRTALPFVATLETERIVAEENPVVLQPLVLGREPLTFGWLKNGAEVLGATNRWLAIDGINAATVGAYAPVVSGSGLSVTGAATQVGFVPGLPLIVTQPESLTTEAGSAAVFRVEARGTGPLNYQWRSGGVALTETPGQYEGTQTPTLTLPTTAIGAASFNLLVWNAYGSATSRVATLRTVPVNSLAEALDSTLVWTTGGDHGGWFWQTNITQDGQDALQSGPNPDDGTNWLETTVTGPTTVSFRWKSSGFWTDVRLLVDGVQTASISWDTDWTLAAVNLPAGSHTLRWVEERDFGSESTPSLAWLDQVQVTPNLAPHFTQSPASRSVLVGGSTTLSASVIGSAPLFLQWQQNGVDLPNATNSSLTLSAVTTNAAGIYRLFASNTVGTAMSAEATVSVTTSGPSLTGGQEVVVAGIGTVATLQWTVSGVLSPNLQWLFNGEPIPGATNASLVISNVQPSLAGNYRLALSSDIGSTTSSETRFSVLPVAVWGSNNMQQNRLWEGFAKPSILSATENRTVYVQDSNGYVSFLGQYTSLGSYPPISTNLIKLSSRKDLDVGLEANGTVVLGNLAQSPIKPVPPDLGPAMDVAAGASHVIALKTNGTVVCWGDNGSGQCSPPAEATNHIVSVVAGRWFSAALRADGRAFAWGTNTLGLSMSAPPEATNLVMIAAGNEQVVGMRADGSILLWGSDYSIPEAATNCVAIFTGDSSIFALHAQGTLTGWGGGSAVPAQPPYLSNVVAVAAGMNHAWALIGDGKPVITVQPRSRLAGPAGSTLLVVKATGAGPLAYQWSLDGVPLIGATNSAFAATEGGVYRVRISNALGEVDSIETDVATPAAPLEFDRTPGALVLDELGFGFRLTGLPTGTPIVIYASTNLVDWLPVFTNPPSAGAMDFVDPGALANPQRFYRAGE